MSVICFPLPPCPRFPLALAQELPLTASFRPDRGFPVVELPVRAVSHLFPASSPADLASRLREVSVAHAGIPAAAAPHRISPCARAGAVFVAAFPASFRPLPRGHAVEPLTLAVVLANAGTPFAALNALQNAPFRFQSRERSGPQARESERFERPRAREVLSCWTTESLRIHRSLWPSLWQSTAAVRGPERASGRTVPLSEPRAKRAAGLRERAVPNSDFPLALARELAFWPSRPSRHKPSAAWNQRVSHGALAPPCDTLCCGDTSLWPELPRLDRTALSRAAAIVRLHPDQAASPLRRQDSGCPKVRQYHIPLHPRS